MKLIITIDPVGDVLDAAKLLHQVADKLQQQVRQLQLKANIVSTLDHDEIVGMVEFIPDEDQQKVLEKMAERIADKEDE